MEKRELKHWINNARQMLVGAEDLLNQADRECELPENDLNFLDNLIWNATSKLQDVDEMIRDMKFREERKYMFAKVDAHLERAKKLMEGIDVS